MEEFSCMEIGKKKGKLWKILKLNKNVHTFSMNLSASLAIALTAFLMPVTSCLSLFIFDCCGSVYTDYSCYCQGHLLL